MTSPVTGGSAPADDDATLAGTLAEAVLAVDGVTELHAGMFGEAATYLPGGRVIGMRVRPDEVDVHVVMAWGSDVRTLASRVHDVVRPLAPGRGVSVTVEDVAAPERS